MGIKIVADRMIDLSLEEQAKLNITTIGCYINMGTNSYSDMDDITPEEIAKYMDETKQIAKTAAKSPEVYADFFKQFVDNGDTVIHFAASNKVSAICNHSKIAAAKFPGKVFVIDTLNLSGGALHLVMHAVNMVKAGEKDAEKIVKECTALIPKIQSSFLIDTLELMYKSGRCNGFTYFGANIFKIKPVIGMCANGEMRVREKFRGKLSTAIENYIASTFTKYPNPDLKNLYITYAFADKEIEKLIVATVNKYYKFENIKFNQASCNCFVFAGKKAIGMFYICK